MFTYTQTNQLKTAAESKGLELWKENSCYTKIGNVKWRTTIEDNNKTRCRDLTSHNLPNLTLDNLLPWLDKILVKDGDKITNPEWEKAEAVDREKYFYNLSGHLKNRAMELYFTEPQTLADILEKEINNLDK